MGPERGLGMAKRPHTGHGRPLVHLHTSLLVEIASEPLDTDCRGFWPRFVASLASFGPLQTPEDQFGPFCAAKWPPQEPTGMLNLCPFPFLLRILFLVSFACCSCWCQWLVLVLHLRLWLWLWLRVWLLLCLWLWLQLLLRSRLRLLLQLLSL